MPSILDLVSLFGEGDTPDAGPLPEGADTSTADALSQYLQTQSAAPSNTPQEAFRMSEIGASNGASPASMSFLDGLAQKIGVQSKSGKTDYSDPKTIDAIMRAIMGGASVIGALTRNQQTPQNFKSAAELRAELLGPYNKWTPTQQASADAFFNKPMGQSRDRIYSADMKSPIVAGKGYAMGGPIHGLPGAQAAMQTLGAGLAGRPNFGPANMPPQAQGVPHLHGFYGQQGSGFGQPPTAQVTPTYGQAPLMGGGGLSSTGMGMNESQPAYDSTGMGMNEQQPSPYGFDSTGMGMDESGQAPTFAPMPMGQNPELNQAFAKGGPLGLVNARSGGQSDVVPINAAGGEYMMDADAVSALGDGNNAAGAAKLDAFRQNLREHKRSAPSSKIPPKAKPIETYMKKGH